MSEYHNLLSKLDKVRKAKPTRGQVEAHRAICPVCGDDDWTKLSLGLNSNGTSVAHCFTCGSTAPAICDAVGFDFGRLLPNKRPDVHAVKGKPIR